MCGMRWQGAARGYADVSDWLPQSHWSFMFNQEVGQPRAHTRKSKQELAALGLRFVSVVSEW